MPLQNPLQNSVRNLGDQGCRHISAVHLLERSHNIPRTHALGIQGKNLVIKLCQSGLALTDELGLKRTIAVARRINVYFPVVTFQGLTGVAITAITGVMTVR